MGSNMALMGDRRSAYRVCWGDLKERSLLGDLVLDGRTVLSWIFKKWVGERRCGLDWSVSG